MEMKRAISIDELLSKKFKVVQFDGPFAASIGPEVELSGNWIIYATSGHGKTEFSLQLAKYLTQFTKVLYNTMEEGARYSFQKAVRRNQFKPEERRKINVISEPVTVLIERLKKPKSASVIFMDSLQYSFLTKKEYVELKALFPNKLFIWISHADGSKPRGSLAGFVEYDADVKIRVNFFLAMFKSRFEGKEDYIINQERYAEHYNEIL